MSAEEEFDGRTGAIVGAAGPAVSLVAALMTAGVWWLFPAVYPYTRAFLLANLTIGLFNLLPVYPLDGSMVVLSRARNRLLALKIMQVAGIAVSVVFFVLFVVSVFFGMNFTVLRHFGVPFLRRDGRLPRGFVRVRYVCSKPKIILRRHAPASVTAPA